MSSQGRGSAGFCRTNAWIGRRELSVRRSPRSSLSRIACNTAGTGAVQGSRAGRARLAPDERGVEGGSEGDGRDGSPTTGTPACCDPVSCALPASCRKNVTTVVRPAKSDTRVAADRQDPDNQRHPTLSRETASGGAPTCRRLTLPAVRWGTALATPTLRETAVMASSAASIEVASGNRP